MNNTKKNIYIVLLIVSIISNMILLYKKISIKNYYKESYLVLQDGKQINIYSIDDSANYAQTECQFRYCGTAIPFLTVRSTAR